MTDRVARSLASLALALALVAVVLAGYAVVLGEQYRQDVQTLGETLGQSMARPETGAPAFPLHRPPPALDTGDP